MAAEPGKVRHFDRVQRGSAILAAIAILVASSQTADTIHPIIPDVAAIIAVLSIFWLIPSEYRNAGIAIIIGALTVNILVGLAVLPTFAAQFPSLPRVFASARLAGIVEPITTKALPAVAIIWYFSDRSPELVNRIRTQPWLSGALLGWTFGVVEMLLKVPAQTTAYASATTVTPQLFVASFLHLVTGLLAAGAIFNWLNLDEPISRPREALTGLLLALMVVAAMAIHYWWNAGGLVYVYRTLGLA